jgi:putative ABC transport system permease protein
MATDKQQSFWLFAARYAFKNLWRKPRRTSLTISAVLFSAMVAVIGNRYSVAIMKLWQDSAADTGTAHVQAHAAGYWKKQEGVNLALTMPEGNAFEVAVRSDPRVEVTVRRLELEGIISAHEKSVYFLGRGVEPSHEMRVSPRLFTDNDEGTFASDDDPMVASVARGLTKTLGLKLGDEATLITQTVQGSVNGVDVKVDGIVDANIPSFTHREVFVNYTHLQRLLRMPGRYTELAIRLKPGQDVRAFVADMEKPAAAAGVELRGWWDIEPTIRHVEIIWDSIMLVTTGLLFLSTAISVLNVIFMMVAERTVEIGTLMAIGARPTDVRRLFTLEAAFIGIIGGVLGVALGNLAIYGMDKAGMPFENPFGSEAMIIHPHVSGIVTIVVLVAAIVICWLAAIVPSRKAAMVEPVRAFRGQVN